jgi:hypothetical protein
MPRLLRRAAVLGATANVASKRGQASAQQQQAPTSAPPSAPQPVAAPAAPAGDTYGDLMKLKELLDAGALTQQEFDTQKAKILAG